MAVIETFDLTKYYGSVRGIDGVDLTVERGEVFGFLGPNGAGKTTTIRLLLDLIRPTRGSARVLGRDVQTDPVEIRRRVGYLPGELALYDRMTGRELVEYVAALRGIDATRRIAELADALDLDLDRRIRSYSSGNRQKVGLVQALMHDPELFILDEPTSGLDPLVQQTFYELVREATERGGTVFLSSHVLPEVERIADRVAIIREGGLVALESVDDLKLRAVRRVEIHFAAPVPVDRFESLPSVRQVTALDGGSVVELVIEGPLDAVIKAAATHEIDDIVTHHGDLEDAFLAYYSGAGGAA